MCKLVGTDTLVAAVADGAGSAALSELGAKIAVEEVLLFLCQAITGGRSDYHVMLREGAVVARQAVITEAISHSADPRDFASTLLVVVMGPTGGGALQIGDGVIVVSDGIEWYWVFWPQRGEYANTTYFLTDDEALDRIQIENFAGKVTDVALMTDGLEPLALHYGSRSVHAPFFKGMFQPLIDADGSEEIKPLSLSLECFLSSERIGLRTDDDVSIILASCRQDRQA